MVLGSCFSPTIWFPQLLLLTNVVDALSLHEADICCIPRACLNQELIEKKRRSFVWQAAQSRQNHSNEKLGSTGSFPKVQRALGRKRPGLQQRLLDWFDTLRDFTGEASKRAVYNQGRGSLRSFVVKKTKHFAFLFLKQMELLCLYQSKSVKPRCT